MKKPIKPWSKLSKAGKRIALAKDVLTQVKKGKLIVKTNAFAHILSRDKYFTTKVELQSLLQESKCRVCAMGSLFVCDILNRNKFKVSNSCEISGFGRVEIQKRLAPFFPEVQLDLIEAAFERRVYMDSSLNANNNSEQLWSSKVLLKEEAKPAIAFGKKYKKAEDRLVAIMKNIIKNKGEFKP